MNDLFNDPFFSKTRCDRCGGDLTARTQSWFSAAVICMSCSDEEREIKKGLRENHGHDFEDCRLPLSKLKEMAACPTQ